MILALGILGSMASIIALFLPAQSWRQRAVHALYCAAIILLAYLVVDYQQRLDRVASIERVASKMVADREMEYTHLGYVQASLAFLEKNRDLYPDTYRRALNMCAAYKCSVPETDASMVSLSFAMHGLLKGLATIDSDY
jgi:hypothetical protein